MEEPVEKKETTAPAKAAIEHSDELWGKILEEAKKLMAPGIIPLLKDVRAELRENILYLAIENPLVTNMIKERQYAEPLRESVNKVLGFAAVIRLQKPKPPVEDNSALEALCESVKGLPNVTIV